jgi:shikimate kinase
MATLVLIGPMAAGKTKVGKRLARALDVPATDTDKLVVAEHGPIAEIFDRDGEARFRELERDAVRRALATDAVVSLGGGAVLDPDTRRDLAGERVVYLTVTPEVVAGRLREDGGKRPLVRDGVEQWQRIFESRRPLYEEVADLEVDTSRRTFDEIAQEVLAWLQTTV